MIPDRTVSFAPWLKDRFNQNQGKSIVHPVLVEVRTQEITLDWEAQNKRWVTFADLRSYPLLPGFDQVIEAVEAYLLQHPSRLSFREN